MGEQKNREPSFGPRIGLNPVGINLDLVRPVLGQFLKFTNWLQPALVPGPKNLVPDPIPLPGTLSKFNKF